MFEVSDVDPQSRSYMLSVGEVGRLCHAYSAVCQREPDIFLYNYRDPENAAKVRRKNKILTELIEAQILQGPESVSSWQLGSCAYVCGGEGRVGERGGGGGRGEETCFNTVVICTCSLFFFSFFFFLIL